MDKENVVYVYSEMLFSHKNECNPAICNSMDGQWGYYARWNKSDRERQTPYDLTYIWNLKKKNTWNLKREKNKQKTWAQIYRTDLLLPRGGVWGLGEMGKRGQ